MLVLQLYAEATRLDLFQDETVTIVDSIQEAKDLGVVKGAFSKSFSIPASPVNNQYFGHYYNPAIQNSFDARYRVTAQIHLSGVLFKKGTLRLSGVNLKDNMVFSYKVVFIGDTVDFTDVIEDDTLDQLDFASYDHDFTEANVKTGLESSLSSGAIKYPLIYHTTRYFYTTQFTDISGNALDYKELKPAIKCEEVINQVSSQYGITWATGNFWTSAEFDKLHLWLHRDSGIIVGGDGFQQVEIPYADWSFSTGTDVTPIITDTVYVSPTDITFTQYTIKYNVVPNDSSLWNAKIIDELTGNTVVDLRAQTGTQNVSSTVGSGSPRTWEPKLIVWTEGGIASFTATLELTKIVTGQANQVGNYTNATGTFNVISTVRIQSQIPKMGIVEFISGLFKTFNLVTWVNNDDEIEVKTVDDYYGSGTERDITEYVDVESHRVRRTVPFSKIEYKFQEAVTKLIIAWNNEVDRNVSADGYNLEYGNLEYTDIDAKYDGEPYIIDVPFEKVLYEAQFDNSDAQTELTSGWFVDEKDEPTVGAPLLFYIVNESCSTNQIRWVGTSNSTVYNRPSNSVTENTLNFNAEIDEHSITTRTDSLFNDFHKTNISEIFNRFARGYNFKAVLPLSFILDYSLADVLVIAGVKYRINKIKINIVTGRADLDLRNIA